MAFCSFSFFVAFSETDYNDDGNGDGDDDGDGDVCMYVYMYNEDFSVLNENHYLCGTTHTILIVELTEYTFKHAQTLK